MFLTNILFKKAKSKFIMVLMESAVSGHKFIATRERLAEKLELIKFDPYSVKESLEMKELFPSFPMIQKGLEMNKQIQHDSLYKERKKIRSLKSS